MSQDFKICKAKGCGEEFNSVFSKHRDYCSTECYKADKKVDLKLKGFKPIPNVSKKRQAENLQYQVLRKEFLEKPENKICPITGQPTTDVHHKKGRVGKLFLDTKYWIALSREGHKYVEENPNWAKDHFFSLKRLDND